MATNFNYSEQLGLLRRAVAEPVRQLIAVEYDVLPRLHQTLRELAALNPPQAQVIYKFDSRADTVAGVLHAVGEKLQKAKGSRPAFLALVGQDQIEETPGAPQSQQFWKEMNQAREALTSFDAQILLCVERWSYRQALQFADHLWSWAAMKIHLVGSMERPLMTDRTALSTGLFGDYKLSPELARERWSELNQARVKAQQAGEPASGFLQRFYIPMLEAALSLGDLVLARQTRELAQEHGQFPDEDMPRWHELNVALALAEHEADLASEHAYKLLDLAENHTDDRVRARALTAVNDQALLLKMTANFTLAEPLYRKSLKLAESTFGPEHPEVAILLNNLAQLLKATNRLAEAEPLMRRALQMDEKSFGPEHPTVAIRLNNLARLLQDTNRLAEAELLMRRALQISEKSFGPEHPTVAIRLNNLAQLLQATNRLAEAEPLMRRALQMDEKSLGPEHPDVAIRLNNLASLLHATHRLAEAEPLLRRTLQMAESTFGPEHPQVAIRLNNLAQLFQDTNRRAEAEPLMRRALQIDEKSLGPDHPTVAIRLNNLARLLQDTNRLAEAESLARRAAAILVRSLGLEHPDSQIALRTYKRILTAMELSEPEIQAKLRDVTNQQVRQFPN